MSDERHKCVLCESCEAFYYRVVSHNVCECNFCKRFCHECQVAIENEGLHVQGDAESLAFPLYCFLEDIDDLYSWE